ncbi:MAG: DEAD/DEAH box helicase family protein [Finegoldia sp.]|nr:DEAD/DEAH box helicase family protein [Finegoldia sp.]
MAVNDDGLWTHSKYGWAVSRRNGKSEVAIMVVLWGLLEGNLKMLYTAHRTSTSHSIWEKIVGMLDTMYVEYSSLKAKGSEKISIDGGGCIDFKTRTTTGGLGEGFDLLIIDEAQEYTTDQETALKYVVTASKNPQTLFMGTPPTAISAGTVFTNYRKDVLQNQKANSGWAEWAVYEQTDPKDKEAWYQTNPSLGTLFTERAVEDEITGDDLDFNIQRLGYWIEYNQKSEISFEQWDNLRVSRLPKLTGKLHAGIKYGKDGVNVSLAIAVKTLTGKVFVECIDCRPIRQGDKWILDFLRKADIGSVTIDGANGQRILADEMKKTHINIKPTLPTVNQIIDANALFKRGIDEETIRHSGQASLSQVVTNCIKRNIGTSGGFGFNSQYDDYDIALMDSAILAHWGVMRAKEKTKQRVFY